MDIISRAEWGAQYGDGVGSAPLPASELWLHHSVTVAPDLVQPFDDDYAAIRTIERIGAERFGSSYGFPYTFGVTPIGLVFAGHNLRKNGAHTKGRNSVARAIVLVGNYELDEPTEAQIQAVAQLVRHGHESGWWSTPTLSGGHRDAPLASTACPGELAYARIGDINHLAQNPIPEDDMFNDDDRQRLLHIGYALGTFTDDPEQVRDARLEGKVTGLHQELVRANLVTNTGEGNGGYPDDDPMVIGTKNKSVREIVDARVAPVEAKVDEILELVRAGQQVLHSLVEGTS